VILDLIERLGYALLDLLTLALAFFALLCWLSVWDGTAAFNGDGGCAVAFTSFTAMAFFLFRVPGDRWPFGR
jgi:hypothetical protein